MEKMNFASKIEELIANTPLYYPQRWLQDQGISEA